MINNLQLNKNENDICVVEMLDFSLIQSAISLSQGETTQFVVILKERHTLLIAVLIVKYKYF
jgi:hypothetical protein